MSEWNYSLIICVLEFLSVIVIKTLGNKKTSAPLMRGSTNVKMVGDRIIPGCDQYMAAYIIS